MQTSSTAEIAWAAGIFEGEGNISAGAESYTSKATGARRTYFKVYLQIHMTDEDVIRRVQSVLGGRVTGPYRYTSGKQYWVWAVTGHDEAVDVFEALYPWLGERRREQGRHAFIATRFTVYRGDRSAFKQQFARRQPVLEGAASS